MLLKCLESLVLPTVLSQQTNLILSWIFQTFKTRVSHSIYMIQLKKAIWLFLEWIQKTTAKLILTKLSNKNIGHSNQTQFHKEIKKLMLLNTKLLLTLELHSQLDQKKLLIHLLKELLSQKLAEVSIIFLKLQFKLMELLIHYLQKTTSSK